MTLRGETFGGSFWKGASSPKVERFKKRLTRDTKEDAEKTKVRKRDKRCRFPICGCGKMKLTLGPAANREVSHSRHKGMGGDPSGERSKAALMVLLCLGRHRQLTFSIDRGTARWRPLTTAGANGPIAWEIDMYVYLKIFKPRGARWVEVARESAPGVLEPLTPDHAKILTQLAEMTL
jgi:hypothetical protein